MVADAWRAHRRFRVAAGERFVAARSIRRRAAAFRASGGVACLRCRCFAFDFYSLALYFNSHVRVQTGAQLFVDVLLATWLVWATGNVYSPYSAIYIIVISVASILLGSRGALATAVCCVFAFTGLAIAATTGICSLTSRLRPPLRPSKRFRPSASTTSRFSS
jgi:hypothetical protein